MSVMPANLGASAFEKLGKELGKELGKPVQLRPWAVPPVLTHAERRQQRRVERLVSQRSARPREVRLVRGEYTVVLRRGRWSLDAPLMWRWIIRAHMLGEEMEVATGYCPTRGRARRAALRALVGVRADEAEHPDLLRFALRTLDPTPY